MLYHWYKNLTPTPTQHLNNPSSLRIPDSETRNPKILEPYIEPKNYIDKPTQPKNYIEHQPQQYRTITNI